MEVRQVLAILRRRWLILVIVIGLAALASAYLYRATPPTFITGVRLLVRQQPTPDNVPYYTYDRYYNWFANEFLVDDYTLIVSSRAFADQVAALLRAAPRQADGTFKYGVDTRAVTSDQVFGTISGDRKHRVLSIVVQASDPDLTRAIANAAADALTAESRPTADAPHLNDVEIQDRALFAVLDRSDAGAVGYNRQRKLVDAAVRVALGVVAALALVVLIEFFDDRLRDEAEAERLLGAPVLGRIPR